MSTPWVEEHIAAAIHESAAPALQVIFEGIELSKIELDRLITENEALAGLVTPHAVQQYISMARFLLREHIAKNQTSMGDWRLNELVNTNGAIQLHNGLQQMRLLHHRNGRTAPHAGTNVARIEYFENRRPAEDPALLDEEQRLLLLWQVWNPTSSRLVHTLDKGTFGRSPSADLDLFVYREEDDFSSFEFPGALDQALYEEMEIDEPGLTGTQE